MNRGDLLKYQAEGDKRTIINMKEPAFENQLLLLSRYKVSTVNAGPVVDIDSSSGLTSYEKMAFFLYKIPFEGVFQ